MSAFSHGRDRHQALTPHKSHILKVGKGGKGRREKVTVFLSNWGSRSRLFGFGGFLRSFLCPHDLTQLLWKTNTVGVKLKLSVTGMMTLYCAEQTLYVEKIRTADRSIKLMKLHHMYIRFTGKANTHAHTGQKDAALCDDPQPGA